MNIIIIFLFLQLKPRLQAYIPLGSAPCSCWVRKSAWGKHIPLYTLSVPSCVILNPGGRGDLRAKASASDKRGTHIWGEMGQVLYHMARRPCDGCSPTGGRAGGGGEGLKGGARAPLSSAGSCHPDCHATGTRDDSLTPRLSLLCSAPFASEAEGCSHSSSNTHRCG